MAIPPASASPLSQVGTTLPGTISYQGLVYSGGDAFDGDGYFKFALVNSAGTSAYWANDGTGLSTAPFTPTNHITLTVSSGLFNVRLGDTSIAGMTESITESVFIAAGRSLRVWFNDGAAGWQRLTPDTPLDSMPWALSAANLNSANTFTAGPQTINTGGASNNGLIIKGANSQSANLVELRNSTDSVLAKFTYDGRLQIGGSNDYAQMYAQKSFVRDPSAAQYGLYNRWNISANSGNYYVNYFYAAANNSSGTINQLFGSRQELYKTSTGNVNAMIGNDSALYVSGHTGAGGTLLSMIGFRAYASAYGNGATSPSITSVKGFQMLSGNGLSAAIGDFTGFEFSQPTIGTGSIASLYGIKVNDVSNATLDYSIYTNAGKVHLGDAVDVGGNIIPLTTTYDLGSSGLWWDDIHYHTLTSHSLGVITGTGVISGGQVISCTEVLEALRAGGLVMENGLPHIDYASLPAWMVTPAADTIFTYTITSTIPLTGAIISTPVYTGNNQVLWYNNVMRRVVHGEPGLDVDALTSVNLCAMRELYAREKKLEKRTDVLTQRGLQLEARVTAIEELIRERWPGLLP
jgi:hypothetical protein